MYRYNAKLLRVVDGDTIDVMIDLGFDIQIKKRVRFLGINAPESRTRDLEEKKRGLAAKERVKCILAENETFEIHSEELGKYGRVLGSIYITKLDKKDFMTKKCLNDILVSENHAVVYFGGKR
jgi:micrococcal nuclease|tara:strand:+ start:354 stop:722 length:369 start_codon:yes stop_codon:yes gene_type:complete